jgi:hypothetical protein
MIKSEKTAPLYSSHLDPNSGGFPLVGKYRISLDRKYGFSLVKKNKTVEKNKELCLFY